MTQYKVFFLFGLLLMMATTSVSEGSEKQIQWLTIEEAEALSRENPRKIFVDVYTDWCSWCKRMDRETFTHPVIVDYINTHFYPVKLNAEQKDPIVFRGTSYENENPDGRRSAHNFAIALLGGRLSYPSIGFFDEDLNLITTLPGFRTADKMEPVLVFFKEEVYKESQDLNGFISTFEGSIK